MLKQQIEKLAKLQRIDADQIKIEKQMKEAPARIEAIENQIHSFEQEMEEERKRIEEIKKEYRKYESEVKENLDKIKKSNGRLGEVKNNKEYQSILKEIDEITGKNSLIEDKMLECLDSGEQADAQMKVRKTELISLKSDVEDEKKAILAENEEHRKQMEVLESEKADVLKEVEPEMMTRYKKVKTVVGRFAMARAKNSVCMGCHMNIPPQRYNELLKCEEIILCPHCHRILYYENERPE